ncbi:MAG: D-alanine--D-serine ligase VanG [Clostridia bacterium]|nr:D-alanine--D-serine ligase VanG [Clostridia bacterium]
MKKITVAVLFGGASSEYSVSLSSATSVINNINRDKYDVVLIGITKDGVWYRYNGPVSEIKPDNWCKPEYCTRALISPSRDDSGLIELTDPVKLTKIDVAFPVFHGKNGEDGTIQGLFELAGIKYVGCGVLASSVGMDKDFAHKIVMEAGLDVAKFVTFNEGEELDSMVTRAAALGFPLYVKPVNAGSSIGITKAHNTEELKNGIIEAFKHDRKVTVEENIDGFEVGCAVMGNNASDRFIGEVDEIEVEGGFFDFGEKYSLFKSKIHMPARISPEMAARVKETALKLYEILDCQGLARVDMFIYGDRIVFNEINSIPGFTDKSRYPNMMRGAGIEYPELIDRLIGYALSR